MFFSSISVSHSTDLQGRFNIEWSGTGDSESPLGPLRAAKQRVNATCSSPSGEMHLSPETEESYDKRVLHVKASDRPLRVIAICVALAGSIEQILDPHDIIEPFTHIRIKLTELSDDAKYRLGT